jgi:hypothetical protein
MRLFMKHRASDPIPVAAARAGFSAATGYRIAQDPRLPSESRSIFAWSSSLSMVSSPTLVRSRSIVLSRSSRARAFRLAYTQWLNRHGGIEADRFRGARDWERPVPWEVLTLSARRAVACKPLGFLPGADPSLT